jgi:6-phosphogluconolactonase (cycloisomerase 2 family)
MKRVQQAIQGKMSILRSLMAAGIVSVSVLLAMNIASAKSITSADQALKNSSKTIVYAALGEELSRYELDARSASLTKMGSLKLPANLQFAEFHPDHSVLYAVLSDAGSGTLGAKGDKHLLVAYRIDTNDGALYPYGQAIPLPERPIHITVDRNGQFVLVAFNNSGTIKSYRIDKQGYLGEEVAQSIKPDAGIFTHQVVVTPSNKAVLALARGNDAIGNRPSEIGSYSLFGFKDGNVDLIRKVSFEEGIGPRHLAFHPAKPWVYVGIERGSKLFMYKLQQNGEISDQPLFRKETLQDLQNVHRDRQKGGVVKIHPNGRFAYATNRADGTVNKDGKAVFAGGENTIAVFVLDKETGEPTLIQHVQTEGIEARTFAVDASGTILIVANQKAMLVEDPQGNLKEVDANLALFRIGQDGKLAFMKKYEVQAGNKWLLWLDALRVPHPPREGIIRSEARCN